MDEGESLGLDRAEGEYEGLPRLSTSGENTGDNKRNTAARGPSTEARLNALGEGDAKGNRKIYRELCTRH